MLRMRFIGAAILTAGLLPRAGAAEQPDFAKADALPSRGKPMVLAVDEAARTAALQTAEVQRTPALNPELERIIAEAAAQPLGDWEQQGKVSIPRWLLARLRAGVEVAEANAYLQSVEPWSVSGSTWHMVKGDYDFTEITLSALLYQFGGRPDRLYPETVEHLVNTLLVESGGQYRLTVRKSMGVAWETENHLLMTEGSRYLKNQWLAAAGSLDPAHDNETNGLRDWLTGFLNHLRHTGCYEFLSTPYQGYTVQALVTLEAFCEPPYVAGLARAVLDDMCWRYALGSLDFRQCTGYRRQLVRADQTGLDLNYMNLFMRCWDPGYGGAERDAGRDLGMGSIAALMPYRPPVQTLAWVKEKPRHYVARFGHHNFGCPEIYSGGPGYLLSSGGAFRGLPNQVVARPTALLLHDGARDLADIVNQRGPGTFIEWNNTGVHERFACANGPVHVPAAWKPAAEDEDWRLYDPAARNAPRVAVYAGQGFSVLALFPEDTLTPHARLETLRRANPEPAALRGAFQWPDGARLTYEIDAPPGTWVMKSVDGAPLDRDYDAWPLYAEVPDGIPFSRQTGGGAIMEAAR